MAEKTAVRFINKNKTEFFYTLRKRVDEYFKVNGISKHANAQMYIKTVVLLLSYIIPFVLILTISFPLWAELLLWSFMGVALAGIGMSIMHDACHGAYSENKHVNNLLGYTLNLLGGAVFNWKLQHNVLHHTYTNITDMDEDIDSKLMMRFSPHAKRKWYHKGQVVYAFLFYSILTLYWVVLKDFTQFARYTREGVNKNKRKENIETLFRIIVSKVFYVLTFFILPVYICNVPFTHWLGGWLLMHGIAGMILSVTFQLAHTVENTSYPMPDKEGNIENEWAIHQMNTTVNFARHNKLISWYIGGLNFQVEHHLFTGICHIHYPALAPIVKQTAEEFGVPYLENKTLGKALKSHITTLKKFGMSEALEVLAA